MPLKKGFICSIKVHAFEKNLPLRYLRQSQNLSGSVHIAHHDFYTPTLPPMPMCRWTPPLLTLYWGLEL